MKIALIHGFLKEYGGAERVLEALHEIWPEAPIYTAFVDPVGLGPHWQRIKKWKIRESSLGKTGLVKKLHSPLRFLAPLIWESFNLDDYDVVISSSGWYICRGVITRPETLHICYLHHPPRHLYGYQTSFPWQKYLPIRVYGHLVNHYLRMYDFLTAQRVDYFIANSKETQKRIAKFYRRESVVIYPPVVCRGGWTSKRSNLKTEKASQADTSELTRAKSLRQGELGFLRGGTKRKGNYFLCVSRLARAKNIHLAIKACNKLKLPLKIVGKGREEHYLRSIAGPGVEFLGEISDEKLAKVYAGAKALIFPSQDEEFGIVPVEAMAHGIPVIAYRSGGVKETVVEGRTGIFFDQPTVDFLISAIKRYNDMYHYNKLNSKNCLIQAKKFSKERFKAEIKNFVKRKIDTLPL